MFAYGQVKTDWKLGKLPLRPYISTRFFGDTRQTTGGPLPQHLSDSAAVVGAGIATPYWRGTMAWAEAGTAIRYVSKAPGLGRMTPDYRAGISYAKGFGHLSPGDGPGLFFETTADGLFVSRYGNDTLLSLQNKGGVTMPELGGLQTQFFLNANLLTDARRLEWANFAEFGPGLRFRWRALPRSLMFSVSGLRGYYMVPQATRGPHFYDLRVGLWYAITH